MPSLARRNLFHDKICLTVTLTGVVFAVVLITVPLGLFIGFATTTSTSAIIQGQQAYVTASAFDQEKFYGRVVRIGQILGKKNVRTDEPGERVDTKILETLIEVEGGKKLSPGLRVDSFHITSTTSLAVTR